MAKHGVRIDRVINAGGVPQNNSVLNQVYANVLGKPVLVPDGVPTSLGSGIVALTAAGAYSSIEEAQAALCLPNKTFAPQPESVAVYQQMYPLYRDIYFSLGEKNAPALPLGNVLPTLLRIAADVRQQR